MFNTLKRKYKGKEPLETVSDILKILDKLDLKIDDIVKFNPFENVHSCSINIKGVDFGSGGKGLTSEFSLASGMAELIEDIEANTRFRMFNYQNFQFLKDETGFYYHPNEKELTQEMIDELPENIKESIKKRKDMFYNPDIGLPFFNLSNKKTYYLPLKMIMTSNGLAAGNDRYESMFQGTCEIMERAATYMLFKEKLTPPDVPDEIIKNCHPEYEIIKKIEAKGLKVIIKDFSMGQYFPVIAAIIINEKNNTYMMRSGCETCLQIALARALTEDYQGVGKIYSDLAMKLPEKGSDIKEIEEFMKWFSFGNGVSPYQLFSNTPSYKFNINNFDQQVNYRQEVQRFVKIFNEHNDDLYVCNFSTLGFNANIMFAANAHNFLNAERADDSRLLIDKIGDEFNVKSLQLETINKDLSLKNLSDIANNLFRFINICKKNDVNKENSDNRRLQTYYIWELGNLLAVKFNKITWLNLPIYIFYSQIKILLKDFNEIKDILDKCGNDDLEKLILTKYIDSILKGLIHQEIMDNFYNEGKYDRKLIDVVCGGLDSIDAFFELHPLPKCPDCGKCYFKDICTTRQRRDFFVKMYKSPMFNAPLPIEVDI